MPSSRSSSSDDDLLATLFQEPAGFRPPSPEPTFSTYILQSGETLDLRLVGHNPLWGHHLWHAGRVTATYLQIHAERLVKDRHVLELGAGAGLPSMVCSILGARSVLVTDYPDAPLLSNLTHNISHSHRIIRPLPEISVCGYVWGTQPLPVPMQKQLFDTLVLADLMFNHSEHEKLLGAVLQTLRKSTDARAVVFFTPHRPWLLHKDLEFLDKASGNGLVVDKVGDWVMERPMFELDRGDEMLRRTVYGYELRWATSTDHLDELIVT